MRVLFIGVALTVLALPGLTGCASSTPHHAATASAPLAPREIPILSGDTGLPVDRAALLQACADSDVVIIGENHGHPVGLPFAAALFEDLLAAAPKASLALEFFERDEQSRLDEYLAGVVDEPTFRKRTQRTPSSYPDGHRAMVEAARSKGRPVIAANAPRPLVRLARTEGYDKMRSLSPELQRLFRIPDSLPAGRYHDDFVKLMTGGVGGEKGPPTESDAQSLARAEAMFKSQSVWDWTMADSVLHARTDDARPVVLVVGRFHCDHRGGLVQAIDAMRPGTRVTVVSIVDDTSGTLRDEDRGRGSFVVYVGPSAP